MAERSSAAIESTERELVITRVLDAPRRLVFKAWTEPERVVPERLVLTWAWEDAEGKPGHETLVTVSFAEHGAKTKLTLHQAVFESITARNGHQEGWASALDRLAECLAKV